MGKPLVVLGSAGHGREVLDIVMAVNAAGAADWEPLVVDDSPSPESLALLERRGIPFGGTCEDLLADPRAAWYVIAIGDGSIREQKAAQLDAAGLAAATLVHPDATRGSEVELEAGAIVWAGVRLTTNIRAGRHVHLNSNVTVGHDSVLGDFVTVNPSASISGDCSLGDRAVMGVGAVLLQGLRVGAGAMVGANACVVRGVPDDAVVKGVPAR